MALYQRGSIWWFDFHSNGKRIQLSAKTRDRAEAEKLQELARGRTPKTDRRDELDPAVYFLKSPALGLVKIGCSGNSGRRIEDLKNMNADDLVLMAKITTREYRSAESVIHDMFTEKHKRREWYAITDDDVDFAVRYWDRIKASESILARHEALPIDRERYYALAEVAGILNISVSKIRNMIREGDLKKIKLGSAVRVTGADLDDFLARHTFRAVRIAGKTTYQPVSGMQGSENTNA